jgi:peptidoglycan/LPS O-acetylase OafA/YrhL
MRCTGTVRGVGLVADPWYDYLAFPLAPLLLGVQFAALFVRDRRVRFGTGVAVVVVLFVLLVYVASLDLDASEGANIGAGVLFLALCVSVAMLPFAGIHEVVNAIRGRRMRH